MNREKLKRKMVTLSACVLTALVCTVPQLEAAEVVEIFIRGQAVNSDVAPIIVNDRVLVPLRVIAEQLDMQVTWDDVNRRVIITETPVSAPLNTEASAQPVTPPVAAEPEASTAAFIRADVAATPDRSGLYLNRELNLPIQGASVATSRQLRTLLLANNPEAPDLVDLYLQIGAEYGIRGDLAFCQAAKETGWWRFGNLVQLYQNNYCGLGATGAPATGAETLNGADPRRVSYIAGVHGAIFASPADGVEAHLQHLYAYTTSQPLPSGKTLVDPRFSLVSRGIAPNWTDLNGRWAVPGTTYGQSIIQDYYEKALQY
jgi:hypothetical protein